MYVIPVMFNRTPSQVTMTSDLEKCRKTCPGVISSMYDENNNFVYSRKNEERLVCNLRALERITAIFHRHYLRIQASIYFNQDEFHTSLFGLMEEKFTIKEYEWVKSSLVELKGYYDKAESVLKDYRTFAYQKLD